MANAKNKTYLDDVIKSTFLMTTLIASFKYKDYELKNSIVKFMVYKLIDREISKTYKTVVKYLTRTNQSEEEFLQFLKEQS